MLGWLRDRFAPKPPLEEDFRSVLGASLAARVMAFLQTGQDGEVLTAVGRAGPALELQCVNSGLIHHRKARAQFLYELEQQEPEFTQRLAQVYAAGARGAGWEPSEGWKGELEWLEPLVVEALRVNPKVYPRRAQGRLPVTVLLRLLSDPDQLYRAYLRIPGTKLWAKEPFHLVEGFSESLREHPQAFHEVLASKNPRTALEVIREFRLPVEPFLSPLVKLLSSTNNAVRELAVGLLEGHPEALYDRLPGLAEEERLEMLRFLAGWGQWDLVERWQGLETSERVLAGLQQMLPPAVPVPTVAAPVDTDAPLHPTVVEGLRRLVEQSQQGPAWQRIDSRLAGALCDAIETGRLGPGFQPIATASASHPLAPAFDFPELTLPQAVRLVFHTSRTLPEQLPSTLTHFLTRYRRRRLPRATLLELGAVLEALGENPELLAQHVLALWWGSEVTRWEDEAVWPFFATRVGPLLRALQNRSGDYQAAGSRERALEILAKFPVPPAQVHEELWYLALNTSRPQAVQAMLTRVPAFETRLVAALSDGKQEVRTAAAAWLARLRLPEAEAALRKALAKEKQELARAAMLTALEGLGVPLQEFLNRDLLAKEAAKCALPETLSWFPFAQLPPLQWTTGEAVDPAIPTFWVVRAHKLKVPEANPLLRLYCQQLSDPLPLGRFVLGAWLARDEAAGSATADKGLLALAGACGGGELVRASESYLKTWYGQRAAQCKALLAMLASTGEPLALQLVLSVASRFRTKGIQEEANRQAQLLAERRGWTLAELADRSVPTGGLDPDGRLPLDSWHAIVRPDFSLEIRDEAGKTLSGLPERAADAKKVLSAAKKEIKAVQKLQRERLYEAMCTQRGWSFEDWRLFLWEHPLLRYYCQRLVWAVDGGPASFRPLPDGTLSDVEDRDVEPAPEARITVAHQSLVSAAWQQHLADYEVESLFPQFGREVFELPEERRDEESLADFQGYMLEAFRLRTRAIALGYVRGPAEDGGWFHCYRKSFQELSLQVSLGFSGNSLPEENRQVALDQLTFEGAGRQLALGEVPPILLSESYRDLATIAAEGTGFDPKWAAKTWG